ncbi:MAG: DUF3833 family protein [Azospirillaceae bacterium]
MTVDVPKGHRPSFRLEDFFAGRTRALGLFVDRFGKVRRQFRVTVDGTWDGDLLTLVEDFVYDDGETERRVWSVRPDGAHGYVGEADGVVGTATGTASGNAVNWRYAFDLRMKTRRLRVRFDDWMYRQDDRVMINRARVTKWGILLGEALIFFSREPDACSAGLSVAAE